MKSASELANYWICDIGKIGQVLGTMALDALSAATPVADPTLSFAATQFNLPVVNQAFQAMFLIGVLDHRQAYNYDPTTPLSIANEPEVQTEVDHLTIGELELLTVPGELLPELAIGGYDGAFTPPGQDIIDADNPLPPDLSAAPAGPYLLDRLSSPHRWIVGLGNDEVGYIVPKYNFKLADVGPYIIEAQGDHYEETNSLGPETAELIDQQVVRLVEWSSSR